MTCLEILCGPRTVEKARGCFKVSSAHICTEFHIPARFLTLQVLGLLGEEKAGIDGVR